MSVLRLSVLQRFFYEEHTYVLPGHVEVSVLERCPSYGMSVLRGFTVHFIQQAWGGPICFVYYVTPEFRRWRKDVIASCGKQVYMTCVLTPVTSLWSSFHFVAKDFRQVFYYKRIDSKKAVRVIYKADYQSYDRAKTHIIYWVIFCHLFLGTDQVSSVIDQVHL